MRKQSKINRNISTNTNLVDIAQFICEELDNKGQLNVIEKKFWIH